MWEYWREGILIIWLLLGTAIVIRTASPPRLRLSPARVESPRPLGASPPSQPFSFTDSTGWHWARTPDGLVGAAVPSTSPADVVWRDGSAPDDSVVAERPPPSPDSEIMLTLSPVEIFRATASPGFVGFGVTLPQCPITFHANDGREACLDWRSGAVTYTGDLPVAESAKLFVEAVRQLAPWPPACAGEENKP